MKKSLYIAAFAALALTSCSNTEDQIFDESAADRLEQYKKDYAQTLTADGGLWSMEYFSNPDEPGYLFVMKFGTDGSVTISANHKWIGGQFKQETSVWKMIADNGPVLSFNSYNSLFHIFSDPADILGPDQPTGDGGEDINETGFGHDGDYEFQVMEVSEDGKTVRMLGKKRMHNIYLRRLNPNTDIQAYLDNSVNLTGFVSKYFDYFNLVDASGEPFIVNGMDKCILSVYPKNGDAVSQTRTGNVIFTYSGFRFMDPLEVPRADESLEPLTLTEFMFQEDGSLLSPNGDRIVGPYPTEIFLRETFDFNWYADIESAKGQFANYLTALSNGIKAAYPSRSLESVSFGYDIYDGETVPVLNIKLSGTRAATYYLEYTSTSEDGVAFNIVGSNSQAATFAKRTQALNDFADQLSKLTFVFTSDDVMKPEKINMTDKSDPNNSMVMEIR